MIYPNSTEGVHLKTALHPYQRGIAHLVNSSNNRAGVGWANDESLAI
ncbi:MULTISPECIES: hypothetical protein [Moorena]|uniref:Uncharacterized protein n=1 Tax=Moorena producens (strain JHB) TaxID=1454205 RepID=A0A9Q9SSJ5_MOOP1|nr:MULTISPECIES: hypothetical protein [Moorena]NER87819.1 hypothetical protein [Moorena sp. SIO3A2]NET63641.1 hypothetical protein [Moorena sp. SIO1G6]WAN68879.1 hypothetical protein BJP36_41690 [Moorena producens JHB]